MLDAAKLCMRPRVGQPHERQVGAYEPAPSAPSQAEWACRRDTEPASLGDLVVLAGAQTAQGDLAFDDFASAGSVTASHSSSAGDAIDPLDHVVANIHRIGAFGEDFDAKCILESRGFEGLHPPVGSLDESGTNRLRRASVT